VFVAQVADFMGMNVKNDTPLRLAVFDCDGTLVDSQSSIIHAMHAACDHHGLARPTENEVRRVVGLPLEVAIARVLGGVSESLAHEIGATYKSAFSDLREKGGVSDPLFPGVDDVLDRLDAHDWLMGIATGKSMKGLTSTLEQHGLMDRFVTHQTADNAHGKPHPDMMLKALDATGVQAEFSVMIGDTTFDVEMAKNAGVKVIGVTWGYHEADELMDAGAFRVVDTAQDLTQALLALMETAQ